MKSGILLWCIVLAGVLYGACANPSAPVQKLAPAQTLSATPLAASAGWELKWEKALSIARQENLVQVYTSQGPLLRDVLSRAFTEKYGIKVDFVMAPTSELVNKVRTERNRGLYLADVFITGYTTLINELKPHGDIIVPMEPVLILPEVLDPKAWFGGQGPFMDKEKMVVGMASLYNSFLTRNTDLIKEGDIKVFDDCLKPQYKGKIIMRDPTASGGGITWVSFLVHTWGLEKTKDYLREFVKQEPVLTRDSRLQMESLARGKYPLAIATSADTLVEFMNLGAPVALTRTQHGGMVLPGGGSLGMPGNQPHPNAAAVFINWLLSKEGQTVFIRGYGTPSSRQDVSTEGIHPSQMPLPGEKVYISDEEDAILQGKLMSVTREIFAPLFK